jgi:hypothetical protein
MKRKLFKAVQIAAAGGAFALFADVDAVTAFVPEKQQTKVAAMLTIASAFLPSIAPRGIRKLWDGGLGGTPPPSK